MGTNPLAFAAPAKRNPPFLLDMATTTVAAGKVKVYKLNHKPLPAGWAVDGDGQTVTDPEEAFRYVFERPEGGITPLGGARDGGRPQGLRPGGDGAHSRRHPRRRVVLAHPQPHAGAIRSAQYRPLLHGHRSARLPCRTACSRKISTR